jgi:hypothetical protein
MTGPADDIIEAFNTIADAIDRYATRLEYRVTGGAALKPLAYETVDDLRRIAAITRVSDAPIAAAARGEAATL